MACFHLGTCSIKQSMTYPYECSFIKKTLRTSKQTRACMHVQRFSYVNSSITWNFNLQLILLAKHLDASTHFISPYSSLHLGLQ